MHKLFVTSGIQTGNENNVKLTNLHQSGPTWPAHALLWTNPSDSWRRHQMDTLSALLAISAGNSPVPGEFPAQRPVTRSFDFFSDLRLNWVNNREAGDLKRHRAHYDVTVMLGLENREMAYIDLKWRYKSTFSYPYIINYILLYKVNYMGNLLGSIFW